jgi:hypothetical protein
VESYFDRGINGLLTLWKWLSGEDVKKVCKEIEKICKPGRKILMEAIKEAAAASKATQVAHVTTSPTSAASPASGGGTYDAISIQSPTSTGTFVSTQMSSTGSPPSYAASSSEGIPNRASLVTYPGPIMVSTPYARDIIPTLTHPYVPFLIINLNIVTNHCNLTHVDG